jgi:hypothetical protein
MTLSELFSMKGKNILGVDPPVEDFAFFDLWSKPLGLLYLLEKMRENGNSVGLIDCIHEGATTQKTFGREKINSAEIEKPPVYKEVKRKYHRFGLSEEQFAKRLHEVPRPDAVLVTSIMTYWYGGVKHAIDVLHRELPGVPVILGGVYARLCPDHAASLGADAVITEQWLPDVPHPAMDLYGRPPYGVTMTSFGCPLSCLYCASRVLWPRYARRTNDEVMAEISWQAELGAEDFAFYDDALLIEKEKYFLPLCRRLTDKFGGKVRFHTPNGLHVREIDLECADVMMAAGFKTLRLSLESIDPKVAGASSGKVARGEYAAAVRNLLAAGYSQKDCETYILLGLPGQSVDSVEDTIKFVLGSGGTPKLAEFSPIPGTPLFESAAAALPELRTEPLLHNNTVYSSYFSRAIAPETLQRLKDLARGCA